MQGRLTERRLGFAISFWSRVLVFLLRHPLLIVLVLLVVAFVALGGGNDVTSGKPWRYAPSVSSRRNAAIVTTLIAAVIFASEWLEWSGHVLTAILGGELTAADANTPLATAVIIGLLGAFVGFAWMLVYYPSGNRRNWWLGKSGQWTATLLLLSPIALCLVLFLVE